MDYNLEQALRRINRGTYLRIWGKFYSSNPSLEQGELVNINFDNSTLVLSNTYNSNNEVLCDRITTIEARGDYGNTTLYPKTYPEGGIKLDPALAEAIRNIKFGTYLMIEGDFGGVNKAPISFVQEFAGTVNTTIKGGELKSIDWDNCTLVLNVKPYDRDETVPMDKIVSIDTSRTGPGALYSVEDSPWKQDKDGNWYRINTSGEI